MRTEKNSCPNGCTLPPRKKVLTEFDNHQYGFDYVDYTYCPICGSLMPNTKKKIEAFFEIYHIHPKLKNAERLIYKSEYVSAAREAFVAVESVLKRKSGLDLHGFDLATKALKFEVENISEEMRVLYVALTRAKEKLIITGVCKDYEKQLGKLINEASIYNKQNNKINPMIGAAGISAFPMSARVVNQMAVKEDPTNIILMPAIGANVSGQIASVLAGGIILQLIAK